MTFESQAAADADTAADAVTDVDVVATNKFQEWILNRVEFFKIILILKFDTKQEKRKIFGAKCQKTKSTVKKLWSKKIICRKKVILENVCDQKSGPEDDQHRRWRDKMGGNKLDFFKFAQDLIL